MPREVFVNMMKANGATLVLDTRQNRRRYRFSRYKNDEQSLRNACRFSEIQYEVCEILAPTKEIRQRFRRDFQEKKGHKRNPNAWTEYLEAYENLLQNRMPFKTAEFADILRGPHQTIAVVCACAHHHDCHRSYAVGLMTTVLQGVEMVIAYPDGEPPRRSPRRIRRKHFPWANLAPNCKWVVEMADQKKPYRLLVMSHTRIGPGGFCTNLGYWFESERRLVQFRPRTDSNNPLNYASFKGSFPRIQKDLKPGLVVEITNLYVMPERLKRLTHPEDSILSPYKIVPTNNQKGLKFLPEYARKAAYKGVDQLFPGIYRSNGKIYRPANEPNDRSVGYVEAEWVKFYRDEDKLRAKVLDHGGIEADVPVKGVDLLANNPRSVSDCLVRFSLSGSLSNHYWSRTEHPERCYLMLSHLVL